MKLSFLKPPKFFSRLKASVTKSKAHHIDWGEIFHVSFNAVMPFALVGLINLDLSSIAIVLVFLSKWRMFAVRLNHLPANIRANATDLIVQLSALAFMVQAESLAAQLIIATGYAVWLLLIKPQADRLWVSAQALTSQLIGITALMYYSDVLNEPTVLMGIWLILYVTTFHYISNFDETMSKVLAKIWAFLGLQLAWLFIHWNLAYFTIIPQYVLLQGALSSIAADLYSSRSEGKLDSSRVRFYITAVVVVVIVLIISADWKGQIA